MKALWVFSGALQTTNALSTFQELMNDIFILYLKRVVLVFLDDILIYNRNFDENLIHLSLVLDKL